MSTTQPAFEPWQRVHVVSPLVRSGRGVLPILFIILASYKPGSHNDDIGSLIAHVVALLVLFVLGVVQWATTRWRIEHGTLRIDSGVINRNSVRFPLDQVQAIDTVRPGLARIFGVSELRLRMAGQTDKEGRLAYLRADEAAAVRARLLALAHGVSEHAPEPPEELLFKVNPLTLVLSMIFSDFGFGVGIILCALVVEAFVFSWHVVGLTILSAIAPAFAIVVAIWHRFNSQFNMTVAEAPDGLRVRSGLVEITAETIPRGRIQAVRMTEPIFWRMFGLCRVIAIVAGQQKRKGENRAESGQGRMILPVGTKQEAHLLLSRLISDLPYDAPLSPPKRARWKAPLSFHYLSWQRNDTCIVTTHGRLERVTDWVPFGKIQSIRVLQGPVQRRLKLAGIHLDTAGRNVHAKLADRDQAEVAGMVEEIIDKARKTRTRATRSTLNQ